MARWKAESRLDEFVIQAWPVVEPGTPMRTNWHIGYISEYLQDVTDGKTKRLIINLPPRHMKSILVSVMWPTWEWIHRPESRWLFVSYSAELTTTHSLNRRAIVESEWYQHNWGDKVRLSEDQNRKMEYQNTRRGVMTATSFGGSVLGKGGDRIVIDDPLDPESALSGIQRETANRFFDTTLSTRLNQPEEGAIVLVMQRLHEKDLAGHLLGDPTWTHVVVPTESEGNVTYHYPRSDRIKKRLDGELLWPERVGPDAVAEAKIRLGPYDFASQHQQRPSPISGGMVKMEWWRFYEPSLIQTVRALGGRPYQFSDTASKKGERNDYSVNATWSFLGSVSHPDLEPGYYLLDLWREKADFPELTRATKDQRRRWKPKKIIIEDKSSGTSLGQSLLAEGLPIEMYPVDKDKIARTNSVTGYMEAGLLHLPCPAALVPEVKAAIQDTRVEEAIKRLPSHVQWVANFIREHTDFPNSEHDDQVDTTTMMLLYYEVNPPNNDPAPLILDQALVKGW